MFVGQDNLNTKCPSSFITVPIASQEKLSSYKFLSKSESPKKGRVCKRKSLQINALSSFFIQFFPLSCYFNRNLHKPEISCYIILFDWNSSKDFQNQNHQRRLHGGWSSFSLSTHCWTDWVKLRLQPLTAFLLRLVYSTALKMQPMWHFLCSY